MKSKTKQRPSEQVLKTRKKLTYLRFEIGLPAGYEFGTWTASKTDISTRGLDPWVVEEVMTSWLIRIRPLCFNTVVEVPLCKSSPILPRLSGEFLGSGTVFFNNLK